MAFLINLLPQFEYHNLNDDEPSDVTDPNTPQYSWGLRLLHILPRMLLEPESIIRCKLSHSTIGACESRYVALSYTWGDGRSTVPIIVEGQRCAITQNLASALRTARNLGITTIWADAVCINQQNTKEKNVQVKRMWAIYHHSEYVMAYIGKQTISTEKAMCYIREMGSALNAGGGSQASFSYADISKKSGDAFHSFVTSSWFRRWWIAQEICWGMSVYVHAGESRVTWSELDLALRNPPHPLVCPLPFIDPELRAELEGGMQAAQELNNLRRLFLTSDQESNRTGLIDFLHSRRATEGTDPRDRVFSVLSLVVDADSIIPDYSKSVAEVFQEVAQEAILTQHCSISKMFSYCDYIHSEMVRTWCPKWNVRHSSYLPLPYQLYNAGTGTTSRVIFKGNEMHTDGIRLDCIQRTQNSLDLGVLSMSMLGVSSFTTTARRFLESFPDVSREDPWGGPTARSFIMALTAGLKSTKGCLSLRDDASLDQEILQQGLTARKETSRLEFPHLSPLLMRQRTICATKNNLIGLAPAYAQAGDVICLIRGATMLYCLRPVDRWSGAVGCGPEVHFKLVGECYFSGFMDGELQKDLDGGKRSLETFHIV
ncbi:hypothetical protein FOMA001_g13594 [Fusarium oxysporum f. sp. matthiolae]|nr:hypothetical protein FOMA001_g13594 [Fusarium oxysporum f. sp. matthiolae]